MDVRYRIQEERNSEYTILVQTFSFLARFGMDRIRPVLRVLLPYLRIPEKNEAIFSLIFRNITIPSLLLVGRGCAK